MELREQRIEDADGVSRVITEAFADGGRVARLWADVAGLRDPDPRPGEEDGAR